MRYVYMYVCMHACNMYICVHVAVFIGEYLFIWNTVASSITLWGFDVCLFVCLRQDLTLTLNFMYLARLTGQ